MKAKILALTFTTVMVLSACTGDAPSTTQSAQDVVEKTENAETYTIQLENSKFTWIGENFVGKNHTGQIENFSGEVYFEGETLVGGNFNLDMTTIEEETEQLVDHLKSEDFFDVDNYGTSKFEITSVEELPPNEESENTHNISGNLTIKDTTRNISFPAKIIHSGDGRKIATANMTIDRTEWDVRFGSNKFFDDLGDTAIQDNINFEINFVASK